MVGEVDVANNQLSRWLDDHRLREKFGREQLRFVVGEDGVTAIEVVDSSSRHRVLEKLELSTAVYLALTEARKVK